MYLYQRHFPVHFIDKIEEKKNFEKRIFLLFRSLKLSSTIPLRHG